MKKEIRERIEEREMLVAVEEDLIAHVCAHYKNNKKSIRATAEEFEISPAKCRKILITGGAFTNARVKAIGKLRKDGLSLDEIAEKVHMKPGSVKHYLPYERIIYNMEVKSRTAKRLEEGRKRESDADRHLRVWRFRSVEDLKLAIIAEDWKEELWECVKAYQNHRFYGECVFSYSLHDTEEKIEIPDLETISRGEIEQALSEGCVNPFIHALFAEWGVCSD